MAEHAEAAAARAHEHGAALVRIPLGGLRLRCGCSQQQPELATQVHAWVVDLLAAMDANLDQPTRARILQACGRAEALRGVNTRRTLPGTPRWERRVSLR